MFSGQATAVWCGLSFVNSERVVSFPKHQRLLARVLGIVVMVGVIVFFSMFVFLPAQQSQRAEPQLADTFFPFFLGSYGGSY